MSTHNLHYKFAIRALNHKFLHPEVQKSDLDPSGHARVGLHFTLANAVWSCIIQQSGRRIRLPTRATLVGSKDIAYRVGDLLPELVVRQLREWGIPETHYQAVEEAIAQTLRKATSTDSGGSAVKRCIHIQIGIARIEEFNYYGEYYDAGIARALRESALEGAKQVPAAESAIEALERHFPVEERRVALTVQCAWKTLKPEHKQFECRVVMFITRTVLSSGCVLATFACFVAINFP